MKTLIRHATVVTARQTLRTSVLLEGSRIAAIDPAIQTRADETVDATGLHLIPGVIDDQVHFREPGYTHKEDIGSGSRACAQGGVTTFLEMPNTSPPTTTRQDTSSQSNSPVISVASAAVASRSRRGRCEGRQRRGEGGMD